MVGRNYYLDLADKIVNRVNLTNDNNFIYNYFSFSMNIESYFILFNMYRLNLPLPFGTILELNQQDLQLQYDIFL